MRAKLVWGVVAVVGLTACDRAPEMADPPRPPKTEKVSILIQCVSPDSTYIKVSPWKAELKKNNKDDLEFVVDEASNTDSVFVELKTPTSEWPLKERPPYKLQKGGNGKKELGPNQPSNKATYSYNIRAYCTDGPNRYRRFLIDPDIFVD